LNESELVHELKNGSEQAFRTVVDTWQHMVYNTILSMVQNTADAEELTQDVFVQVFHSISSFKGDSKFSTWLYRIAIRKALDHERKKKTRKRLAFLNWLSNDAVAEQVPDFHHPGVALEQKQEAAHLFRLIKELPEKQRLVFTLAKAEGLPVQDIAAVLGISTGAAESLLFRARSTLQQLLKKEGEKK
jgi:RNA polymerase sigma factor (sigma-70 family)